MVDDSMLDLTDANLPGKLNVIADEILDATEETFILFSQTLPHNDLGIVDPLASEIELEIAGRDYVVKQSPSLLKSTREAGTTGAVCWKVTPLVADWLASKECLLWEYGILTETSNVLELGCGITGLVGMTLAPKVGVYVLTDQDYVMRFLKENLAANSQPPLRVDKSRGMNKPRKSPVRLETFPLDWEQDDITNINQLLPNESHIDLVILCDCIYNLYLIPPLVQNCVDICVMRPDKMTIVLIAQQLRTDAVMEEWLSSLMSRFKVWRLKDENLPSTLNSTSGYAVHVAVLKESG